MAAGVCARSLHVNSGKLAERPQTALHQTRSYQSRSWRLSQNISGVLGDE